MQHYLAIHHASTGIHYGWSTTIFLIGIILGVWLDHWFHKKYRK